MGPYEVSSNYSPGVKFDPTPGVTSFTWDYIGKILEIFLYVAIRPRVRATEFGIYRNSPKYSDTLNFRTPIIFCKNNLFFVPNFGQLVKFLSLNFWTRNYDGLEVQQRSAIIN